MPKWPFFLKWEAAYCHDALYNFGGALSLASEAADFKARSAVRTSEPSLTGAAFLGVRSAGCRPRLCRSSIGGPQERCGENPAGRRVESLSLDRPVSSGGRAVHQPSQRVVVVVNGVVHRAAVVPHHQIPGLPAMAVEILLARCVRIQRRQP